MLEAVGNRLRHAVHTQWYLIPKMDINAFGVSLTGELHHPDRRMIDARRVAAARHRDPHLPGQLCGQPVKLQRAEKADHRLRHLGSDGRQALVLGAQRVGQAVKPSCSALQLTAGGHARQHHTRHAYAGQVAGAQPALLAHQLENVLGVGFGAHQGPLVDQERRGHSLFHKLVE